MSVSAGDTPRTDYVIAVATAICGLQSEGLMEFARQLERELAAANAKLQRFENAKMPEEPIPIGWISTSTFSWLSEDGAIGQAVFQPNRGGAYGGVAIFTGDQFNALRDFAARQSVDVESKQSRIDALMLEYCPNEMTQEQKDDWAAHQKPVKGSHPPLDSVNR